MVTPPPELGLPNIEREVLSITSEILEKFVPEPNKASVLGDLLIGIKRFRNAVRVKAFFVEQGDKVNEHQSDVREGEDETNEDCTIMICLLLSIII